MDTHPFHKVDGEVAVLTDQNLQILLLNYANLAFLNYFGSEAVLRAEERVSLAYHVTSLIHIKNQFFAFVGRFGQFHTSTFDIKQFIRVVTLPEQM
ncbi:hypothetical protein D3C75_1224220 [compost metagenome]